MAKLLVWGAYALTNGIYLYWTGDLIPDDRSFGYGDDAGIAAASFFWANKILKTML